MAPATTYGAGVLMKSAKLKLVKRTGHASITNTVKYTAMSPEPFKDIWR
jgi:hypothetical protein